MKTKPQDIALRQRYMPDGYLFIRQIKPYLQGTKCLAFKATKVVKDAGIYSIELYRCQKPETQVKVILKALNDYYKRIIDLIHQPNIGNFKCFLKVYEIDQKIFYKQDGTQQTYIYIVREYIENSKQLSQCQIAYDKIPQYFQDILTTLTDLHKKGIYYGEISPWQIIKTNVNESTQIIKFVDTYLIHLLNPPIREPFTQHYRYLSPNLLKVKLLQEKQGKRYELSKYDDVWGCLLTVYRIVTKLQPFLQVYEKDNLIPNAEQYLNSSQSKREQIIGITNYQQKQKQSQNEKKGDILKLLKSLTNLENFLKEMPLNDSLLDSIKDLGHPKVKDDKKQEKLKQQQEENKKKPKIQKIAVCDENKFYELKKDIQETKEQENDSKILNYLQKVAFTVFGNRIVKLENYELGIAVGRLEYITPSHSRQKIEFAEKNPEKVVMADCYYNAKSKSIQNQPQATKAQYRTAKVFFKYDGSNPFKLDMPEVIKRVQNLNKIDLKFKPLKKHEAGTQQPKWKSYDEQSILQFNETTVKEMENRLNGIELKKEYIEQLQKKIKYYQDEIPHNQVQINKNKLHLNGSKRQDIDLKLQSFALFSVSFKPVYFSAGDCFIGDDLLEILLNNDYTVFQLTKMMNLSKNKLTDRTLEAIKKISNKSNKGHNFQQLQMLNLSYNQISECTAFKGEKNNLLNLKCIFLNNNKIENLDSYTFSNLPSIQYVDLTNNKQLKVWKVHNKEDTGVQQNIQNNDGILKFLNCVNESYDVML